MDIGALHVLADVLFVAAISIMAPRAPRGRQIFVAVAIFLTLAGAMTRDDWGAAVERGLTAAEFVAAFFTALSTLGNAAASSPAIRQCGRYLSQQPPGRRYAALTVGGQLFSMLLNYGSLTLLGSLAAASAKEEPDAEVRFHRTRRMLLAIERALVSTLPWSPMSFAFTFSSILISGSSWTGALYPSLMCGAILAGSGWLLDSVFKPRLGRRRRPVQRPEGTPSSLLPLVGLLLIIGTLVIGLHIVTGIRVPGIVIVIVPLISLTWIFLQEGTSAPFIKISARVRGFVGNELPGLQSEIVLLTMAGYIGTVGSSLIGPLVTAAGIELSLLPPVVILLMLIWLIPAAGQVGMNPLLSVSLLAPLLPSASAIGLTPTAMLIATTAGWSLSGISSPYTAMAVIIGSFGNVSARQVGLRWNGMYTLTAGSLLSLWVLAYAFLPFFRD